MSRFILLSEPRTGSTFLQSLLKVHYEIECKEDFLSDEYGPREDPLGYAEDHFSALAHPVVGFKTFPEHLVYHRLSLVKLLRHLDVKWVIVMWRENCLESYVSLQIAQTTNVWYSSEPKCHVKKVDVSSEEFMKYLTDTEQRWKHAVQGWPPDVIPIFVKYEDLVQNPTSEMQRILRYMSLDSSDYVFEVECRRQNPAPLSEKVSTWNELSDSERGATIDIPSIVNEAIACQLNILDEFLHFQPDPEPPSPPNGWRYRVSQPYITDASRQNVLDAVDSCSVSSAGRWPQEMIRKLRNIYGVKVAQPCCNGFAAIVLALLAADIGPGDEVIFPTFTMIAVPNAIRFVGASPVTVDSACGDYNPSICEIRKAANEKTKAVIVTHTYGVPTTDMESIASLCLQRGWWLIEDISECAGILTETRDGSRRLLGTFGDFACASMYANKILQGGDAGFVLAKDPALKYRLGSLVNHGFTKSYHFVHLEKAPNFKISGLSAALACGNLDSLQEIMNHRSFLALTYRRYLQSTPLKLMPRCGPDDTPWVFGVCCANKEERQGLRELLANHGTETRNYFFPVHAQPAYNDTEAQNTACFSNADKLAETGFYLPTFTALTKTDIEWVCSVIKSYFTTELKIADCPDACSPTHSIRVDKKTLMLKTRRLDGNGYLVESVGFNHYTTVAVSLRLQAERFLLMERWDRGEILLENMRECIAESRENGFDAAERVLQPFVDYIVSQRRFELSIEEPWTNIDLTEGDLIRSVDIPTTTEPEVFQLLCWSVQKVRGVPRILELGSLFGASTAVMAVAARQQSPDAQIVAVDSFVWQPWMNRFQFGLKRKVGESFLDVFQRNTSFVSDAIQAIQCNIGSDELQRNIENGLLFDVVFLDFTRDIDELETAWLYVKQHLKDGLSIVVLNSITVKTIPFVVQHQDELVPIAKPQGTRAKAFWYVKTQPTPREIGNTTLKRSLHFLNSPDWNHHQGRAFNVAINALRDQIHSPNAEVDFIPALEEFICDSRDQIRRPWVGIVHGVPEDDQFYPPDMKRLCSKRYRSVMKLCRGLFTLTNFQATYLRDHVKTVSPIPICPLRLPMLPPSTIHNSDVVKRWKETELVDLVFIGSFARDFSFFCKAQVPPGVRKVLLTGDDVSQSWATTAPSDVATMSRLDAKDYEEMLSRSVVMLALKYNGAANTIVVECIARNVPIVAPRIDSCIDYLGGAYPLLYDPHVFDLTRILSVEKVQEAIDYLSKVDKNSLSIKRFCDAVQASSVLLSLAPEITDEMPHHTFDATVCVCSYKRTHNIDKILDSLFTKQTFSGAVQVIVWNNNEAREKVVRGICEPYLKRNSPRRCLELISSTSNHYCIIRACMTHLMRSDVLLICDDDIIPKPSFVQFFVDAHRQHTNDIIGVRGHKFLPHQLNHVDPRAEWTDYDHVRFVNDDQPEQSIHFIHADTCLIPRDALQQLASIPMPDSGFILVDDYWMSFVLSHYFNRKLRKLQCREHEQFVRTMDSDELGLALYTRPEVHDAKIRMYIHHMLNGWPAWTPEPVSAAKTESQTNMMELKKKWWNGRPFIGCNVPSDLTRNDAVDLLKLGIRVVRIGAVGCREDKDFEFSGFLDDPKTEMEELRSTVAMLAEYDVGVIITLHERVASAELWTAISAEFSQHQNIIGYDLLNEPHVEADTDCHFADVSDMPEAALAQYLETASLYCEHIRSVDTVTPIVIEPTFWARPYALPLLSDFAEKTAAKDQNIIVSVHFYEPQMLVSRIRNRGRCRFPGDVPVYECKWSEVEHWNEEKIRRELEKVRDWQLKHNVKVFVGEFGIARETPGAAGYLTAVANACLSNDISCLFYSFRETTWDAMNYELGPELSTTILNTTQPWKDNPLTKALMDVSRQLSQKS